MSAGASGGAGPAGSLELERLVVRLVGDATSYLQMLRDAESRTKDSTDKIERSVGGKEGEGLGTVSMKRLGHIMQALPHMVDDNARAIDKMAQITLSAGLLMGGKWALVSVAITGAMVAADKFYASINSNRQTAANAFGEVVSGAKRAEVALADMTHAMSLEAVSKATDMGLFSQLEDLLDRTVSLSLGAKPGTGFESMKQTFLFLTDFMVKNPFGMNPVGGGEAFLNNYGPLAHIQRFDTELNRLREKTQQARSFFSALQRSSSGKELSSVVQLSASDQLLANTKSMMGEQIRSLGVEKALAEINVQVLRLREKRTAATAAETDQTIRQLMLLRPSVEFGIRKEAFNSGFLSERMKGLTFDMSQSEGQITLLEMSARRANLPASQLNEVLAKIADYRMLVTNNALEDLAKTFKINEMAARGATAAQQAMASAPQLGIDPKAAYWKSVLEERKKVIEDTLFPLQKFNREHYRLSELFRQGAIDGGTYTTAMLKARQAIDQMNEPVQALRVNSAAAFDAFIKQVQMVRGNVLVPPALSEAQLSKGVVGEARLDKLGLETNSLLSKILEAIQGKKVEKADIIRLAPASLGVGIQ